MSPALAHSAESSEPRLLCPARLPSPADSLFRAHLPAPRVGGVQSSTHLAGVVGPTLVPT